MWQQRWAEEAALPPQLLSQPWPRQVLRLADLSGAPMRGLFDLAGVLLRAGGVFCDAGEWGVT
jgi:hypothetical protein